MPSQSAKDDAVGMLVDTCQRQTILRDTSQQGHTQSRK